LLKLFSTPNIGCPWCGLELLLLEQRKKEELKMISLLEQLLKKSTSSGVDAEVSYKE
jgi:hypothetical protein